MRNFPWISDGQLAEARPVADGYAQVKRNRSIQFSVALPPLDESDVDTSESVVAVGAHSVHSVYGQPDADSVAAQSDRIVDALADK
ncbi:hypothetical protein MHAE_11451 [Mycobacterium haemophilum DSM 44634]|nr:hypothetical protein B586_19160 [Mycobacterium haemophilum DSM 44634]